MKSLLVLNPDDFAIIYHHVYTKNLDCIFGIDTIDFKDKDTYLYIRSFMERIRIKFKINKKG